MKFRDVKYLLAYFLPASAFLALFWLGSWAWATVVLSFVILPVLEGILPQSVWNVPASDEPQESGRVWFDWLLYLNAPLLFAIVGQYFFTITQQTLTNSEWAGLTLSVGIIVGACGINVAHELGHRSNKREQALAKLMLLPALYQHFFIEHNRGHHKHVATPLDPATARYGEWLFVFWVRSVFGGWRNAWRLEAERLSQRREASPLGSREASRTERREASRTESREASRTERREASRLYASWWENEMLRFQMFQLAWLGGIYLFFGWQGLLGALLIAAVGFLLLETINYVEHYGLQRRILPSGRPEPVRPAHSWNSDHEMGRIFLYELTRHSDHHYKASRKYQILRHLDESPQLPLGYPASVILALAPPLWFWVMNPRVKALVPS
jgi:alkane 1-monooxygenase